MRIVSLISLASICLATVAFADGKDSNKYLQEKKQALAGLKDELGKDINLNVDEYLVKMGFSLSEGGGGDLVDATVSRQPDGSILIAGASNISHSIYYYCPTDLVNMGGSIGSGSIDATVCFASKEIISGGSAITLSRDSSGKFSKLAIYSGSKHYEVSDDAKNFHADFISRERKRLINIDAKQQLQLSLEAMQFADATERWQNDPKNPDKDPAKLPITLLQSRKDAAAKMEMAAPARFQALTKNERMALDDFLFDPSKEIRGQYSVLGYLSKLAADGSTAIDLDAAEQMLDLAYEIIFDSISAKAK